MSQNQEQKTEKRPLCLKLSPEAYQNMLELVEVLKSETGLAVKKVQSVELAIKECLERHKRKSA